VNLPTFKPNDIDYARLMREWELLNDRNQVLERENAALREDKERLDWLLMQGVCWRGCDTEYPEENWVVGSTTEWLYSHHGKSGRSRIDAAKARKEAQP